MPYSARCGTTRNVGRVPHGARQRLTPPAACDKAQIGATVAGGAARGVCGDECKANDLANRAGGARERLGQYPSAPARHDGNILEARAHRQRAAHTWGLLAGFWEAALRRSPIRRGACDVDGQLRAVNWVLH